MKTLLLSIIFVLFQLVTYANPVILHNGARPFPIHYLGNAKYNNIAVEVYATQESLNMLDNWSDYRETKKWALNIVYAPVTEEVRKNTIKGYNENSAVSWVKTPSGSRRFWGVESRMFYNPNENVLLISFDENLYNDHGEIMGLINGKGEWERNNLSEHKFIAEIARVVNNFLAVTYPPIRKNAPAIE